MCQTCWNHMNHPTGIDILRNILKEYDDAIANSHVYREKAIKYKQRCYTLEQKIKKAKAKKTE